MQRCFNRQGVIYFLMLWWIGLGWGQQIDLDQEFELCYENCNPAFWPCGFYRDNLPQYRSYPNLYKHDNLNLLSSKPPVLQDSTLSPSGKFMLHFDRHGTNAVPGQDQPTNGIPDYIDRAGEILDRVWDIEIDSIGFQPPLDANGQPVHSYHVYFIDLKDSYGTTYSVQEIPGEPDVKRYTSYIVLDNDYSADTYLTRGLDGLRVTAAHEFHHAIQLSYRVWWEDDTPVDLYFMEMSSTWIEDIVFKDINRYLQYLPVFFNLFSDAPFNRANGFYPYGNSLFLHMLEKKYGSVIVKDIWDKIRNEKSVQALQDVLSRHGSSFSTQLHEYGIWLLFTGSYADIENYFPEGHLYPQTKILNDDVHAYQQNLPIEKKVAPYASRILEIDFQTRGTYISSGFSETSRSLVSYIASGHIIGSLPFNQQALLFLQNSNRLRVVLTNPYPHSSEMMITFTRDILSLTGKIRTYPNPVNIKDEDQLHFSDLPPAGEIHIFTPGGYRIKKIPITSDNLFVAWDLKDDAGQLVSTGVYMYLVESANSDQIGKIVVVR